MKAVWIVTLAFTTIAPALAAEDLSWPGKVSSEASYAPAAGETAQPYVDILSGEIKGPPGLVSEVHFTNDRFDIVYLRTRLLNGIVRDIRLSRGQTYSASTHGEPAICMCWDNLKPVYRCLSPDPVAVPVNAVFHFGQNGSFQKCSASF